MTHNEPFNRRHTNRTAPKGHRAVSADARRQAAIARAAALEVLG